MSRLLCDVVVLGAGPGGAMAAALCAARGLDVVVLERGELRGTHLPESWVGGAELLMDGLCGPDGTPIDWRKALRAETTVLVRSASSGRSITIAVRAGDGDGEDGVRLDRVAFDALLVDHARTTGATVLTGFCVDAVVPPGPEREALVRASNRAGESVEVSARVVLDASGKSAVLGRQLDLLVVGDTVLDPREAVFTHIRPGAPSPLTGLDTMTVIGTERGYVFVIPIGTDRVSVGVVAAHTTEPLSPEELFGQGMLAVPDVAELVAEGQRLLPVITALNRTYHCREKATGWYALIGDAAAFTDPFTCSGLDFALQSGALAANLCTEILAAAEPLARRHAADTYCQELSKLLADAAQAGLAAVAGGNERELLNALTDPHLPSLLSISAHAYGSSSLDARRDALAAGRSRFVSPRGDSR